MYPRLKQFYMNSLLPELASPCHPAQPIEKLYHSMSLEIAYKNNTNPLHNEMHIKSQYLT